MSTPSRNALAGWKWTNAKRGIVLTVQLTGGADADQPGEFERLDLKVGDVQLRSLARDLARAAEARGMTLYAKRPWWRFWSRKHG